MKRKNILKVATAGAALAALGAAVYAQDKFTYGKQLSALLESPTTSSFPKPAR